MSKKKYRIVIDTNVLVSAMRSRKGASYKLLSLLRSELFIFVLSAPLVFEYEMLLKRDNMVSLSMEEIDELLDLLCLLGERQALWYLWRPLLPDPGDDFIAELAVNSQANFIVTYNRRHFESMKAFGVGICSPKEFLELLNV